MQNDEVDFFNMRVWSYYDSYVSNSLVSIELFNTYSNNNIGCQRVRICISKTSLILDISTVYRLIKMIKSLIINKLNDHKKKISTDQSYTDGFSVSSKKNIYLTYMWCPSSNSPCIRIMIGDKVQTILDSEKSYIPIIEFMSFYEILEQIFNNHVNSSFSNYIIYELKFLNNKKDIEISKSNNDSKISDVITQNSIIEDISDDSTENTLNVSESEKQNDFDSFLKTNRDSFKLDIDLDKIKQVEEVQKKTERNIIYKSKFIDDVLKNDFKNLEDIITNCVNSKLPFDSFVDTIRRLSSIDLYKYFEQKDINSLNYIITRNIKTNVLLYIQKKIKLPNATIPIIVKNSVDDKDIIDIMFQLFLTYVYITKVRTLLKEKVTSDSDNEDFFAYSLKTITSPIVFSFLLNVDKEIFKNTLISLYNNNVSNKFYDNFESKLKKFGISNFEMTSDYIIQQAERIYDTALKMKDKLEIQNFFNNKIMVLNYNDFCNNELTLDSIYKLCELDWCYISCGNKIDDQKLTIKSYEDIPLTILNKYGLHDKKYDNSILVRYFTEKISRFKDLEQIKKINNNIYDVLDDIDIMSYPENALKAIYFWDKNKLPKNIKYTDFVKMIDDSSLSSSSLISMILDKNDITDDTFYNSYLVSVM